MNAGSGADDGWLRRDGHGYIADVDPSTVDAYRFDRMVAQASR